MEPDTEPDTDEPDTDELAEELAEGIGAAVGGWTQRCVGEVMMAWRAQVPPEVAAAAAEAGRRAAAEVGAAARELLGSDIDEQRGTPLALVRAAVRYPSEVLAGAGAPPRQRDRFSAGRFPDDPYDLSPASWADVDPRLVELALAWGAAKAWEHKARHGPRPAGGAGR